MRSIIFPSGVFLAGIIVAGAALTATPVLAATLQQLLTQGPLQTSQPKPDPSHIPIVFGKDIAWKCNGHGHCSAVLFGDPAKPGLYGQLTRWYPGHNSEPHFHSTDRYAYVVSGTWWVSSSTHYDPSKMYPIPAGSLVTDLKDKIHWDGAKAETGPTMILLVSEGPMTSTSYVPRNADKPAEGQDFVPPSK